jgi:hypothetical protein
VLVMPEALTHGVMPWSMVAGRMRQVLIFRFEPQYTGSLGQQLPPLVAACWPWAVEPFHDCHALMHSYIISDYPYKKQGVCVREGGRGGGEGMKLILPRPGAAERGDEGARVVRSYQPHEAGASLALYSITPAHSSIQPSIQ